MSLQDEKYRALRLAKEFLYELIKPGKRLSKKDVRTKALNVLRHWPYEGDVLIKPDVGMDEIEKESWQHLVKKKNQNEDF